MFAPDERPTAVLLSVVVDTLIGLSLISGSRRWVLVAVTRLILGATLYGFVLLLAGSLLVIAWVGYFGALLSLFWRKPSRDRRILAASIFVAGATVFHAQVIRQARATAPQTSAPTPPISAPGGKVVGHAVSYTLDLPRGWREVPAGTSDMSLERVGVTRALLRTHVATVPETATIDMLNGTPDPEIIQLARAPLPGFPIGAQVSDTKRPSPEGSLRSIEAVVLTRGRVFTLVAGADAGDFPIVEHELRSIINSFRLPEGIERLPSHVGRALSGRVRGATGRYSLNFPNGWHGHQASSDAGQTAWDLWAIRPFRSVNVQVELIPLVGVFRPSDVRDSWVAALAAQGHSLQVLEERPATSSTPHLVYVRARAEKSSFDHVSAFHRLGTRVAVVQANGLTAAFDDLGEELRTIVASFQPESGTL